jgi:hypothetical protein
MGGLESNNIYSIELFPNIFFKDFIGVIFVIFVFKVFDKLIILPKVDFFPFLIFLE